MNETPALLAPFVQPSVRTTAQWQAADAAHFLHPFTDFQSLARKGSRVIERAEGVYLWDTDGNKILDGMSGLWCVNVGYGRAELVEAATRQLKQLAFYNAFFQTTTQPAVELAELLSHLAPPQFEHVFFTNSGSEANDTVVRMVRRYWDLMGQPERQVIISRKNAYHGSTMAGASLSGMSDMHAQGGLPIPGIVHIDQPYYFEHGQGMSRDEFGLVAAGWLEQKIQEIGADKIAAFIGEPVQGAGGVIIPPDTYWPEIQRICDRHGVLLVSDEVICGFGRTGHWFGSERFGSRPDLMAFAKGVTSGYIPLGGVMVGERVARVLIERGGDFNHGFTYSGHPVACAVALANLRVIQAEHIVNHVRDDLSPQLQAAFADLSSGASKHPLVGTAETCGMMGAVHLLRPDGSPFDSAHTVGMLCRSHCFEEGVVMRAVGDRMIIAPPLVMTASEMVEMMASIRRALDRTWDGVKRHQWV
jgi:putrescine aminotransferase